MVIPFSKSEREIWSKTYQGQIQVCGRLRVLNTHLFTYRTRQIIDSLCMLIATCLRRFFGAEWWILGKVWEWLESPLWGLILRSLGSQNSHWHEVWLSKECMLRAFKLQGSSASSCLHYPVVSARLWSTCFQGWEGIVWRLNIQVYKVVGFCVMGLTSLEVSGRLFPPLFLPLS